MNENQIFTAVLEKHETNEATAVSIPFDPEKIFGAKRAAVCGTINGAEFRSTLFRMRGKYLMVVSKKLREAARAEAGETVRVEMRRDDAARTIETPKDLQLLLNENPPAQKVWENLSFTHRKEYAQAIEDAKKPETRARRLQNTLARLAEKAEKTAAA